MPKSMSSFQHEAVATQLPVIVNNLAARRQNKATIQLVTLHEIIVVLAQHGTEITEDDLVASIAIAVKRRTLRAEGDPPHSVTAYV